jgi:hypothetical protein
VKGSADALDEHTGSKRLKKPKDNPRRVAKRRLKEPQIISVKAKTPAPMSSKKGKTPSGKGQKKALRRNKSHASSRTQYQVISDLIYGDAPPIQRTPKDKTRRGRVKYRKWILDSQSWNFKRSPCLKQLKNSLRKVVRGANPFYEFKDLFKKVKVDTLGIYNRLKSILNGGLLVTTRSIGFGLIHPIRKVGRLSFREMELLVSKLPFWATSYSYSDIRAIAFVINNHVPVRVRAKHLPHNKRKGLSPELQFSRCARRVPTGNCWEDPYKDLLYHSK